MINDVFVTTTLQDLMDKLNLESEQILEVYYTFALDKPSKKVSIPTDEWISTIFALKSLRNTKVNCYAVGFFNGDMKIYDGKDSQPKELISVTQLHQDKIEDLIFVKSESIDGNQYLISCS
jgi:hypothetical protein